MKEPTYLEVARKWANAYDASGNQIIPTPQWAIDQYAADLEQSALSPQEPACPHGVVPQDDCGSCL